jgi:hypothetical protein
LRVSGFVAFELLRLIAKKKKEEARKWKLATMMAPKRPGEDDLELAVKRQRMDGALVVAGDNNTSQTNNQLGVTSEVLRLLTFFFNLSSCLIVLAILRREGNRDTCLISFNLYVIFVMFP